MSGLPLERLDQEPPTRDESSSNYILSQKCLPAHQKARLLKTYFFDTRWKWKGGSGGPRIITMGVFEVIIIIRQKINKYWRGPNIFLYLIHSTFFTIFLKK